MLRWRGWGICCESLPFFVLLSCRLGFRGLANVGQYVGGDDV